MTLFTMDAAYFLMPYAGGTLIALGSGFDILFYLAAGHIGLASILMKALGRRGTKEPSGFCDPVSLHCGEKEGE